MSRGRKWLLAGGAAAVIAAGGAIGAYLLLPRPAPDAAKAAPAHVVQYLAGDRFGKLSEDRRQEYFEQVRKRSDANDLLRQARQLPPEQQKMLRENTASLFLKPFIEPYYKLPPEQRVAYLDRLIDVRQAARALMPSGSGARPGGAGGPGPGLSGGPLRGERNFAPQDLRGIIEKTDPLRRAQFIGFVMDMEKRMAQRGLPVPK